MASVSFRHVTKRFPGGTLAVNDLTLDVIDTEFMVLVGPSGCGKSTALRMLAGLEDVSEGEVLVGDRLVNDLPPGDRDIAMVFQSYALYPHMTVQDNMAFGLRMRSTAKAEIERRVQWAAEVLELGSLLKRKPRQLSGGQRQRVALGRAIVRNPRAFLLDEPLSNLDAKLRVQTRIELQKQHRALHATFIYVTHDQVEAMTMGDRVAVMSNQATEMGKAILGVRPEAVSEKVRDGMPVLDFKIEVAEILGADQFIYGTVGGDAMTARVDPQLKVDSGDRIRLGLDTRRLHLFEATTGKTIQ